MNRPYGGSEAGLSYLIGGIGKLGGKFTDDVLNKLVDKVDNILGKVAIKLGGKVISEVGEENLQAILGPWYKELTTHIKQERPNWEEFAYNSLLTAITTVLLEGNGAVKSGKTSVNTGNLGKIGWDGRAVVKDATGKSITMDRKKYEFLGYDEKGSPVYQDAEVLREQVKEESKKTDNGQFIENINENPKTEMAGIDLKHGKTTESVVDKSFKEILAKAQDNDKIDLDEDMEKIVAEKRFEEIQPLRQKLSNRAVRRWYNAQDAEIPSLIDRTLDLEGQARQACDLRNRNRKNARELMHDLEKREQLDRDDPNKTFEELIADKIKRKGLTREEAMKDICDTATKTRKSVNKQLGLE